MLYTLNVIVAMMPIQRTESLTTRPMRNRGARTFRPLEVTGLPHSAATSASTSVTEIQSSQASFGFTLPTTPARRNPSSLRPAYAGTGRGAVSPSGFARNSRRTPRPSSASTTASRSPSPTSTGIAFSETGRASWLIYALAPFEAAGASFLPGRKCSQKQPNQRPATRARILRVEPA